MRKTLDIDDDVLLAAEEIGRQRGIDIGKALSELARKSLPQKLPCSKKNGLPLFPIKPSAGIVTMEIVNKLRDELP